MDGLYALNLVMKYTVIMQSQVKVKCMLFIPNVHLWFLLYSIYRKIVIIHLQGFHYDIK